MRHFLILALGFALSVSAAAKELKPVKVFILSGQSNMEGKGRIDPLLNHQIHAPETRDFFAHLHKDGKYIERDDVWINYLERRGKLTVGYGSPGRIGLELEFGHVMGNHYDEPVLLIKTAWGGKSIHRDFRPPSSGGSTGEFYKKMLAEYREGLVKLGDEFPQLAKRKPELSGFVWFQGWNDMFDGDALKEYEANLINLVKDVRKEFRQPNLPVVIGELGNGGPKAGNNMLAIREAQKAAAKALGPNTMFVQTTQFARPAKESPNVGHGHHWYGNAESYFLIGDALGQALLRLTGN